VDNFLSSLTIVQAHLVYGLAWLSFGAVHSLLAGPWAKQRMEPALGAYYRLLYNLFAVVHIGAAWTLGLAALGGFPAYMLEPPMESALLGVSVLGWLVLVLALREYDLGLFSGLSQIRAHRRGGPPPGGETLVIGGMHRFVRHPLYLGVYLILWAGAQDDFGVATAVWGSVYLALGTHLEEKKLVRLYGDTYRDYRNRVPALIPWKALGRGRA
jgi:protein-S-isoprenylcysteine O-methyltransferase Ste14